MRVTRHKGDLPVFSLDLHCEIWGPHSSVKSSQVFWDASLVIG